MEKEDVMVDLKINRRESGLSNKDLAHLLDVNPSRISRLQTGDATLMVGEAITLSLIFGKNIDQLLSRTTQKLATHLKTKLAEMPPEPENWTAHIKRLDTLNMLADRLQIVNLPSYEF